MTDDLSPARLIERLRAGDPQAAEEIFNRYARRLIALASTRLDERMRRRVDPDDVVQSAMRSFYRRAADGRGNRRNWLDLS